MTYYIRYIPIIDLAYGLSLSALGAAALDGKLYVCGGYDGVTSLRSVECYDASTNQWKPVADMTRQRSAAGVTLFDGQLYSLGGHDGLNIFDSVSALRDCDTYS